MNEIIYAFLEFIDSVSQYGLLRLFGKKRNMLLEKIRIVSVLTLLGEKFGGCKLWSLPCGKFLSSLNFYHWGGGTVRNQSCWGGLTLKKMTLR